MITSSVNKTVDQVLAPLVAEGSDVRTLLASPPGPAPAPVAQGAAASAIRRSSRIHGPSLSENVKATTEELEAEMPAAADRAQCAAAPAIRRSARTHGPTPSVDFKPTTEELDVRMPAVADRAQQQNVISRVAKKRKTDTLEKTPAPPAQKTLPKGRKQSTKELEAETSAVADRAQQQNTTSRVTNKRKADALDKTPAPPAKKTPSKGRKQSSKIVPVRRVKETRIVGDLYSNDCASLPAAGALRNAHLIDVEKYMAREEQPEIKMGDFIVTILYKYSPEVLKAFLDVDSHTVFSFTRREKAETGNMDLSIKRFNSTVHVTSSLFTMDKEVY